MARVDRSELVGHHAAMFDRYVVVDWSASSTPKTGADSIWIADLVVADELPRLTNPATRRRAERDLDQILTSAREHGERVMVAVDVALGYPVGTVEHFSLDSDSSPWWSMWTWLDRALADDDRNVNDRFSVAARLNGRSTNAARSTDAGDGPFWGCPPSAEAPTLRRTKPSDFPVPEFRATDAWLRRRGQRPFSVWQLLGVGSVGSQTLTALPVLRRLVERHAAEVWPFTTGWRAPVVGPGSVVVVEVWPSGFELDIPEHWIKDAGQVDGVARRLRELDGATGFMTRRTGEATESWWQPDLGAAPDPMSTQQRGAVAREEGWIFGVT